jgi:hypothetical protein
MNDTVVLIGEVIIVEILIVLSMMYFNFCLRFFFNASLLRTLKSFSMSRKAPHPPPPLVQRRPCKDTPNLLHYPRAGKSTASKYHYQAAGLPCTSVRGGASCLCWLAERLVFDETGHTHFDPDQYHTCHFKCCKARCMSHFLTDGDTRVVEARRPLYDPLLSVAVQRVKLRDNWTTDGSANLQVLWVADLPYGTQRQNPGQDPQLSPQDLVP